MNVLAQILENDSVGNELKERIESGRSVSKAHQWSVNNKMMAQVVESRGTGDDSFGGTRPWTEAVILEFARPTLLVRNNRFELPESNELKQRLLPAQKRLERRLPSVGRIEFKHHPTKRWGGTGWMIAERTIVTNRHVAEHFAILHNKKFIFLKNFIDQTIEACVDFREEYAEGVTPSLVNSFEVGIESIIFMEKDDKKLPDVAFLKLSANPNLPEPIPVLAKEICEQSDVAVIGYPARDSRGVESTEAARRIFGNIYDVKRLSPGRIMLANEGEWYFTHDATTLGGNSGSVVLDLETGHAVGLHFLGLLHEANYAVRGQVLLNYLAKQKIKVVVSEPAPLLPSVKDAEFAEEGTPEDYADRKGYDQNFLGGAAELRVQLPKPIKTLKQDILSFDDFDGKTKTILNYTHFSVMMSKSRRLCIFSAVNIDGNTSKKRKRTGWLIDPRIPQEAQIMKECYGNPPKFSRGHMTRREDPVHGDDPAASLGNSDSMHVTNAVPQMQPFNGGIWLGLEDYALDNAREDEMRISVFTGPFLRDSDPEMYGVKIPVEFWKVIAFVHDKTGQLCATGYTMSQESFLQQEEFVFGAYETHQVPIASIEEKARVSFNKLKEIDPYKAAPEGPLSPLVDFSQIRFS